MSLYKMFATNTNAEKDGVILDYGQIRFRIARAGGSNAKFRDVFKAKIKPYRRQIDSETMDEGVSLRLLAEAYAEAVVLGWESKNEKGEWVSTIEGKDGTQLPFNAANCTQVLIDLPELFADVQAMATQASTFRREQEAADVKN